MTFPLWLTIGRANFQTMKKLPIKFFLIFFLAIFGLLFFGCKTVSASRLYFNSQEAAIGAEQEFWLELVLDAENSINTVSATITIPPDLEFLDIITGNSIINLWVDIPKWDETKRVLNFSGIIPGGFSGMKARILIIKLKTKNEGVAQLVFDKEKTEIFLNSPDAEKDPALRLDSLNISIIKGAGGSPAAIIDSSPPENFIPEITRNSNMFNGDYFLVFLTQDKGTGVDYYEVSESQEFRIGHWEFGKRKWIAAKSPYVLTNQKLSNAIWVKAIDRAGNERIAIIPPRYPLPWYKSYSIWVIMMLTALIAISGFSISIFYGGKKRL